MVKSLPESFLSWKGSSLWRGFVIDKYKSWVTAAGNLEKRGMNDAEIASILGISESKLAEAFEYIHKLGTDKETDKEADKLKN